MPVWASFDVVGRPRVSCFFGMVSSGPAPVQAGEKCESGAPPCGALRTLYASSMQSEKYCSMTHWEWVSFGLVQRDSQLSQCPQIFFSFLSGLLQTDQLR